MNAKALGKVGAAYAECTQKQMRKRHSQQLDLFERDPTNISRRVVTMDETWVHYYTAETKQQSKQSRHCTTDQLFYFCQSIIDSFQEKPPNKTTAVFLDMTSAFDRVWREKLLKRLHNIGEELPEGARLVLYADDQFLIIEAASRAKAEKFDKYKYCKVNPDHCENMNNNIEIKQPHLYNIKYRSKRSDFDKYGTNYKKAILFDLATWTNRTFIK
ncbi:DAGLA [Cordylochernes scorpioides]|uniref:DAGLA n=1 Tax=Cordylochernes scorpioides TaxID=51811 RepID=A0ABY6KGL3_9ARAC|nr:DAGLA [Cordylochernes scorpioides]